MAIVVSKAHQALVAPPEAALLNLFPDAPKLPDGNIIIPHDMRAMLVMRHMGWRDVPNPMMLYYDWSKPPPSKMPFDVQRATCRMLSENPHAYVLNQMGTGKTKCVLWTWDFLNKWGHCKKILIVAPLSTLRFVWKREAFETLPGRKVAVLHGTKQQRLDALNSDADIFVINHDGLRVIEKELSARRDIDVLCLDELAVYRNNSDRSKKMRKFAQRFSVVWGLTGSPMPNEPTDVWAQCKIITPNSVPEFQTHCRDLLMVKRSNYVWVPKPDAVERAYRMMQPSVRFTLDDVLELPDMIPRPYDVALSKEQEKAYKDVATAMQAMVKDKVVTAQNAGVAMSKLVQIAGGWVYSTNSEIVRLDPTPRILALADLINSAEQKILVAVPYRHAIDGISKIFSMKGVGIDHCVVHGDTKHREDIFTLFQTTGKYKCMLAHPVCIHHGVTLTAADTIIWYLPYPSLEVYDQFNARIRRIGQMHKQQVFHLQATPIEKKIYRLLYTHQRLQDQFLQLVANATGETL